MPLVSFYTPWKHHKTRGDSSGFVKTLRIIIIFQSHISPPVICGSLQKIFRCPLPEISWSYLGLMQMHGKCCFGWSSYFNRALYLSPYKKPQSHAPIPHQSLYIYCQIHWNWKQNFYGIAFIFGHSNNALARKGERKSLKNESVKQ